jgi:hypothetical protein
MWLQRIGLSSWPRWPLMGTALVAALSVGLLTTAVYAAIPSPGGVISACVANNQVSSQNSPGGAMTITGEHAVTLLDTAQASVCQAGHTLITWNQAGPQGPQGATAPQGNPGVQGPPGTALATSVLNPDHVLLLGNSFFVPQVVATLNLPAGSYSLFGRVQVESDPATGNGQGTFASCTLAAGGDNDSAIAEGGPYPETLGQAQVLTLNVLHTFSSPGTARISCGFAFEVGPGPTDVSMVRLTAVQVTTVK